jgi:hypothetical protein
MTHSPSNVHETRTMGVATIVKDATLVLKGLTQRRLEASCVMPISWGIFLALGNIIKYYGKTNPSVYLENYRLACRAGGVNVDLFII